ncbi:MAG: hypothetical protein Aurels2KO_48520 [Aureliella sp.]
MIKQALEQWDEFWFKPTTETIAKRTRISLAIFVAVWFASFLPTASTWFGADGILNLAHSSSLLGFAEVSRSLNWSPLWLTDSILVYQAWLLGGIALALVVASGWGGRPAVAALSVMAIAWSHRIFWLTGPVEPAMMAMLMYVLVQPATRVGKQDDSLRSSNQLAVRLVQVHTWILLAAGCLSSLASLSWWRGEGAWWLAATGRSTLFTMTFFEGRPWLVNLASHLLIVMYGLTLWLLTKPAVRPLGLIAAAILCMTLGLIGDQVLYAALLAIGASAFASRQ